MKFIHFPGQEGSDSMVDTPFVKPGLTRAPSSSSTLSTATLNDSSGSFGSNISFGSQEKAEQASNAVKIIGKTHLRCLKRCNVPDHVMKSSFQTVNTLSKMIEQLLHQNAETERLHEEETVQKREEYIHISAQYEDVIKTQQEIIRKLQIQLSKTKSQRSQLPSLIEHDEPTRESELQAQVAQEQEHSRELEEKLMRCRMEHRDLCEFVVEQDKYTCHQETRVKELEAMLGLADGNL